MGLLSSLFGSSFRDPPREKWDGIIASIHARLADERRVFFEACIKLLRMLPDSVIKHCTMTPRIELIITVYQVRLACDLLEARQYVPPADGRHFVTMLFTDACHYGGVLERDELMRRYQRPNEDAAGRDIELFYHDLTSEITGKAMPAREAMHLTGTTVDLLVLASRITIAAAFGDRETVRKLEAKAEAAAKSSVYP